MLNTAPVSAAAFDTLKNRIQWTHDSVMGMTTELSQKGFARQPGPFAPAIGWHVWHLARFADRLQAQLNQSEEIWSMERLADRWVLDGENLGIMNNGLNMPLEKSSAVVELAGKEEILQYAADTFAAVAFGLEHLQPENLDKLGPSTFAYEWEAGKVIPAPDRMAPMGEDLVRYLGHASRHLGMIEALLGVVFEVEGTASI